MTGFGARRGYNLAAGLGTVDARYFVPELAGWPVTAGVEHRHSPFGERISSYNGNLQRVFSYSSAW